MSVFLSSSFFFLLRRLQILSTLSSSSCFCFKYQKEGVLLLSSASFFFSLLSFFFFLFLFLFFIVLDFILIDVWQSSSCGAFKTHWKSTEDKTQTYTSVLYLVWKGGHLLHPIEVHWGVTHTKGLPWKGVKVKSSKRKARPGTSSHRWWWPW